MQGTDAQLSTISTRPASSPTPFPRGTAATPGRDSNPPRDVPGARSLERGYGKPTPRPHAKPAPRPAITRKLAIRRRNAANAGGRRRWRKVGLLVIPILLALATHLVPSALAEDPAVPAPADPVELSGHVRAADGELILDGRRFEAIGFNDYRATAVPGGYVCDEGNGALSAEQLGNELDRARAAGATVLRSWFFQSSWDPDGDGNGSWAAFDRLLDAAAARGIRVIPVLANHWADCENGAPERDIAFYADGYRKPRGPYAHSFLDYARMVGAHYADSEAVAYWELVNEPEAPAADGTCDESAAAAALAGFAADVSGAVREVDPNHAISLGTIGGGQCGTAGGSYMQVHASLDICQIHAYDGPETGTSATTPLPEPAAAAISACSAAGKPIVAGELGFDADLDESGIPTGSVNDETLAARAQLLADRTAALEGAGADGYQLWQLVAEGVETEDDPYAIGPCDPIEAVVAADSGAASPSTTFVADGDCEDASAAS